MTKKLLLSTAIVLTAAVAFAQPATNEAGFKKTEKVEKTSETQPVVRSSYFNQEERIQRIFKNNEIPADFPKAEAGMSFESYKVLAGEYVKSHPLLWNEEYARKREAHSKSSK